MMFASSVHAKGIKGGSLKGSTGSKPAAAQQKKTDTTNQAKPASQAAPAQSSASSANPASAPAANASAQSPSLLQSAMPALVGGAVGSYVGSKLADDGKNESVSEENKESKDGQILKP
ncbi:hypothetical protein ABF87_06435 [Nitrosomonas sp. JL21]|nr:hypothetical protein [Nitrosomonas sp. JL21]